MSGSGAGGEIRYGAPLRIREVKAADDGWRVLGYASTFGNVDLGGDVIHKGAFAATLKSGQPVRFLYGHDANSVLGKTLSLREDDKGLYGEFRISKTRLGQDVHTLLVDEALDSFSIGYLARDYDLDDETGIRTLKEIELLECSLVSMPMNPQARVTGTKGAGDPDQKAVWTAAYINALPDSAFAVVLGGGEKDEDGRTTPRSLRKLPHHNAEGALDLPHLRNALSREPQTDMPEDAHRRARAHLARHARAEGIGTGADALPIEDVLNLSSLDGEETLRLVNALWERRREEGQRPSDRLVALVDAYRQKCQAHTDALLALVTAPSEKAASALDAHLRRARLNGLRLKRGLPLLPPAPAAAAAEPAPQTQKD